MPKPHSIRIPTARRRALYIITLGAWLSGGLWLAFHYFLTLKSAFGPQPSPLEPWWLKLHGAFALAAIWLFGLLWGTHITIAWPSKRRRASGIALTATFLWLILSGYLLYYVGNDTARSLISLSHWTVGLASPVLYWLHRRRKKRKLKSQIGGMSEAISVHGH